MNVNLKDNMQFTMMRMGGINMLDATKRKLESQQQAKSQVDFFEKQKENLKNIECADAEEIARKLEMFHNYEEEIAAIKHAYNQEQMTRALEEARERGEKIAEAAEKMEPKTEEERKEELIDEALGIDEEKGVLTEILDDMAESIEESMEDIEESVESVEENAGLIEESAESAEENAGLVEESTESVEENAGLIGESAENVEENAGLIRESAESVEENTEYIEGSAPAVNTYAQTDAQLADTPATEKYDAAYASRVNFQEAYNKKYHYVPIDVRL